MPRKDEAFEFKLSRFGLFFFTIILALFLLFSFICGVIVGKNIESYPEKIARGIPSAIKEKIVKGRDIPADTGENEDDFEFTFYDTLKGNRKDIKGTFAGGEGVEPPEKYNQSGEKQTDNRYMIQIASFKDKSRTDALKAKLSDMGYSPKVDEVILRSSGRWFRVKLQGFATYDDARRVASLLEKKVRGIKCLVISNGKSG